MTEASASVGLLLATALVTNGFLLIFAVAGKRNKVSISKPAGEFEFSFFFLVSQWIAEATYSK